ncbi:MAG: lipopolysaccharide biosynthesis protein [Polyangiaceae bacterium]|nr:lipopolysaccharide biosynthesis protein [Polyangiaceae bacterium]
MRLSPPAPETGAPDAGLQAEDEPARAAGRGGLAITAAKAYFIVLGLVQQLLLPPLLGAAGYGAYTTASSVASITYNPVVTTSIQGVSRAVATSPAATREAVVRRLLGVHAAFALALAAGFWAIAPWLVGSVLGAPHVVRGVRLLAAVMFVYGLYAPLVGVLNGERRWLAQAGLDAVAGTLRTVGLVAGAWWVVRATAEPGGLAPAALTPMEGAILGFAVVTVVPLLAAARLAGLGRAGSGGATAGAHLAFAAPLLAGQVLLNLLLQADVNLLRAFGAEAARHAGLLPAAADPFVGAYRMTQLFSFLPYQLLISVTFVLFPMLAAAAANGDREQVARLVRGGVRVALLVAGLMVSVTSGLAPALLRLVFPRVPEAIELGAPAMRILTLGFGAFAVFGILTSVLNALGRERQSVAATAAAVALVAALGFARVRGTELGTELLVRMALATSAGLLAATTLAAVLVQRAAGAVVAPKTAIRVVAGIAACVAAGRALDPRGAVATLASAAALGGLFLAILVVTRELGRGDLAALTALVRRRAGAPTSG